MDCEGRKPRKSPRTTCLGVVRDHMKGLSLASEDCHCGFTLLWSLFLSLLLLSMFNIDITALVM